MASTKPDGGVKVVVRMRPWSDREKQASVTPVVSALSAEKKISVIKEVYGRGTSKKHVYHFDEVFTNFTTQEEVFNTTMEPMINDVLHGFEGTVFAYGQTGTGKTYAPLSLHIAFRHHCVGAPTVSFAKCALWPFDLERLPA